MSGGELAAGAVAMDVILRPVVEMVSLPGVRRALAHIHANPAQALGCRDIADLTGLSISQCARQFRRLTGVAPHRYLLQVRVAHVKVLLRESERDLALIAMDAGFCDQSHMTRVFRRLTGMTPGAFREASRAK